MTTWYYRYHLDSKIFWGCTDQPDDDPICGYTQIEPIYHRIPDEILLFCDDHWEIQTIPLPCFKRL